MREVVVALALRTPVGKAKRGSFAQTRPDDLGAAAVRGIMAQAPGLDPLRVGDVIMGCAMPEGEQGMNVGRNIALMAGLPDEVPGMTINRFCSSGLETVNLGALKIAAGQEDVIIAGGVESMTLIPMGGQRYLPNPGLVATDPDTYLAMGLTAERLAVEDELSREDQDTFALASHMKALAAIEAGNFKDEIVPVATQITKPGTNGKPQVIDLTV
ncbi:MAG: beta-ketoacyl synthase N-terminal-like domain-containing protein, partial [Alphaproteobacteria bacterium]